VTDFWVAVSASVYDEMKPYLDYSKEKNIPEGMEDYAGDVGKWAAIDRDTKLLNRGLQVVGKLILPMYLCKM